MDKNVRPYKQRGNTCAIICMMIALAVLLNLFILKFQLLFFLFLSIIKKIVGGL